MVREFTFAILEDKTFSGVSNKNSKGIIMSLGNVWTSRGHLGRSQWEAVFDMFGRNEFLIFGFGTFILSLVVFWTGNIFFMILDLTGRPSFFLRYKIQPEKNSPVALCDFWRAVKVAAVNQTVVGIPFIVVLALGMSWRGCSCQPEDLPSLPQALLEMVVFTLFVEIGFYYSHRLIHHPRLYQHIHKVHHEWTAPIGIVALYAHPLEHVIANMLPLTIGPVLLGSHLCTAWIFWTLALHVTIVNHCGYHLPFLNSPEAHDYHHLKFNTNYGVIGLLDHLHGTDASFCESVGFKRDFRSFSTIPVSVQVPEPDKWK